MKKILFMAAMISSALLASCGGQAEDPNTIVLFDGTSLEGWRGYGKDHVPARWVIEDGCLKFNGSGGGEAQTGEGGDIIFDQKFKNFELSFEWKISEGGNSGVFYLAQEIKKEDGSYEPIYISAPEYQILDNVNHIDAGLGVDGNRKSASLYDMIPAKPQNSKGWGEWNTSKIVCYKGTVVHYQNDQPVVEYHLWTPQWTAVARTTRVTSASRIMVTMYGIATSRLRFWSNPEPR